MISVKKTLLIILVLNSYIGNAQISRTQIDENWNGWRGLKHEGVSHSDSLPVEWSDESNIKWKIAIPGCGYSSPIAFNDNVYLTTSYKTRSHNSFNVILTNIIIGISLIILIYLTVYVNQRLFYTANLGGLILISIFSLSLLLMIFLVMFSENVFDYQRCDSRKWVGSSVILFLSIFSSTFLFKKKSIRIKRILGFSVIILILFFFVFMPEASINHLFRSGLMANNPRLLYLLNLFYLIIALAIIFNLVPFDKPDLLNKQNSVNNIKSRILKSIFFWIINLMILLILLFVIKNIITTNDYLSYRFGSPIIEPIFGWRKFILILISWLLLVIVLNFNFAKIKANKKILSTLRCFILIVGVLFFINTNYISVQEKHCRAIVSIRAESGKINWISEGLFAPLGNLNQNSPASPTPFTNRKNIYAYFGSSGLFCCNLQGEIIWRKKDLPFESYYGIGASPFIYRNKIIIVNDSPNEPFLVTINADNGSEIWRKKLAIGFSNKTCGSSRTPLIKTINGVDIIIIWRGKSLNTYNLANGEELSVLMIEESQLDLVSSLISDSLSIFLADTKSCRSIKIENLLSGNNTMTWTTKINGPNIPSPILINKLLFVPNDRGQVYCINPIDGKIIWKERLPGRVYFSSPIANSNNLFFTDNNGLTTVIKPTNKFEVISNNFLKCDIHASLVPYRNNIFIRSFNELYCLTELTQIKTIE